MSNKNYDLLIIFHVFTASSVLTIEELSYEYTPPRPSEISEHIGKAIFDIPFVIRGHAENIKKSLVPFRIYQQTSTANSAIIYAIGLDWLC